jgi:DNA-directed RNA polymerase subunit omega
MIEALKSDEMANRFGGRFKLCALIQRRLVQLMDGARPMVDRNGRSDLELVIEEITSGKLSFEFDPTAEVDRDQYFAPDSKMLAELNGAPPPRHVRG